MNTWFRFVYYRNLSVISFSSLVLTLGFPLFFLSAQVEPVQAIKPIDWKQLASLPLHFEKNQGQIDSEVAFLSRSLDHTVYFTPREVLISITGANSDLSALHMKFVNANYSVPSGKNKLLSWSNYFIGNDVNQWRSHIPHYKEIFYFNLFPGIDAVFYGNGEQMEYDMHVAAGSDPSHIAFEFSGMQDIYIDKNGNLRLSYSDKKEFIMGKPIAYQMQGSVKEAVNSDFIMLAKNETSAVIGFSTGVYDAARTLIIDPVINYSSFLGGTEGDSCLAIAIDKDQNTYITGQTRSANFPTLPNDISPNAGVDQKVAFITAINSTGTDLIYSTFLGGQSSTIGSKGLGIAVDQNKNAYITGYTTSFDFPTKGISLSPSISFMPYEGLGFVTSVDASGSQLRYSSLLGGEESESYGPTCGYAIAVSGNGEAYLAGSTFSENFPLEGQTLSPNADPSKETGFITVLSASGSSLIYSSYLGGSEFTRAYGIALDGKDQAYVVGVTNSSDFPTQGENLSPKLKTSDLTSNAVGFVSAIKKDGLGFVYSTFLGGNKNNDFQDSIYNPTNCCRGVAVSEQGQVYVTGHTWALDFPTMGVNLSPNANPKNKVGFVSALAPSGEYFIYSSYLGGSGYSSFGTSYGDQGNAIAVDNFGNAYVTGYTYSNDFPVQGKTIAPLIYQNQAGFISAINPSGEKFIYSSYLGGSSANTGYGIAVGKTGIVYVVGETYSLDFPIKGTPFAIDAYPKNGVGFITSVYPVNCPSQPKSLQGVQKRQKKGKRALVNILTWKRAKNTDSISSSCKAKEYRIYRDSTLSDLIGVVKAKGELVFEDPNREAGVKYSYFVVTVDTAGNISAPASIVIP